MADDAAERIVDLVGDAGAELAERGELLRLHELRLRIFELARALGDARLELAVPALDLGAAGGELFAHLVEGARERAHFVVAGERRPGRRACRRRRRARPSVSRSSAAVRRRAKASATSEREQRRRRRCRASVCVRSVRATAKASAAGSSATSDQPSPPTGAKAPSEAAVGDATRVPVAGGDGVGDEIGIERHLGRGTAGAGDRCARCRRRGRARAAARRALRRGGARARRAEWRARARRRARRSRPRASARRRWPGGRAPSRRRRRCLRCARARTARRWAPCRSASAWKVATRARVCRLTISRAPSSSAGESVIPARSSPPSARAGARALRRRRRRRRRRGGRSDRACRGRRLERALVVRDEGEAGGGERQVAAAMRSSATLWTRRIRAESSTRDGGAGAGGRRVGAAGRVGAWFFVLVLGSGPWSEIAQQKRRGF